MKEHKRLMLLFLLVSSLLWQCGKKGGSDPAPPPPSPVSITSWSVNGTAGSATMYNVSKNPVLKFNFSLAVNKSTVTPSSLSIQDQSGNAVNYATTFSDGDKTLTVTPSTTLSTLSKYSLNLTNSIKSAAGGILNTELAVTLYTQIDSSRKFPLISDDSLLTLVQKQTFKYFWDYAHPVSGLARERSNSGPETVTSGGSGFGIMAIVTGINRGFITRAQGLTRMQTIVNFLKTKAQTFHGAFPHWLSGTTGTVIPFSDKDDGADLVETSYLMAGLLTARQYFDGGNTDETVLRDDINTLWNAVDWNWFRQNNQNVLYWHWSPNNNWYINMKIQGWNECLITYILAASSPSNSIPSIVYSSGWAKSGAIKNGGSYYGYTLPLGEALGGPLFFSHYSFLGINPNGLSDTYGNYQTQTKNHTLINYEYCKANPLGNFGYSDSCWGLTASDIQNGYTASSPTNDVSTIAPTAALSSFPYTPTESMKALKFFYYVLGDKIWGDYGFKDAFSLKQLWYANSYLAIDQGPVIVMIENYRSGLIWNLLTSCPEIKTGMKNLGFSAPYL